MFGVQRRGQDMRSRTFRGRSSARPRRGRRLWVPESLEDRILLSSTPNYYTVNLTSDTGASSGTDPNTGDPSGDLLWAITQANANSNPSGSVINFDRILCSKPQTITLSGTLTLSETAGPEVIKGPGANVLTISGDSAVEVLSVSGGVTAILDGLTIAHGSAVQGGGIFNLGTTTVSDSTIADNSHGGVDNYFGSLTLSDCNIAGNSGVYGGGIFNNYSSSLDISASTVTANSAQYGGGVENYGTMTVSDSTFAANSSSYGGAIFNISNASTVINDSTIADNSAVNGGGLLNFGTAVLNNTIVALNSSDIGGSVSSASACNLIGTGGSGELLNGVDGNQVGVADPGLSPLGAYGGPTETIALLPGSPAIGAGSDSIVGITLPTNDQRGVRRPSDRIDIGAFQDRGFVMTVVAGSSPQWTMVDTAFRDPLAVIVSSRYGDPVAGGVINFTATPSALGASATLSAGSATIGANGEASLAATANGYQGGYLVKATAAGVRQTVRFNLDNVVLRGGEAATTGAGAMSQSVTAQTAADVPRWSRADPATRPRSHAKQQGEQWKTPLLKVARIPDLAMPVFRSGPES
jgi:hypothetical protein